MAKQTSDKVSSLAAKILSGAIAKPTPAQIKSVAGAALANDETKGPRKPPARR